MPWGCKQLNLWHPVLGCLSWCPHLLAGFFVSPTGSCNWQHPAYLPGAPRSPGSALCHPRLLLCYLPGSSALKVLTTSSHLPGRTPPSDPGLCQDHQHPVPAQPMHSPTLPNQFDVCFSYQGLSAHTCYLLMKTPTWVPPIGHKSPLPLTPWRSPESFAFDSVCHIFLCGRKKDEREQRILPTHELVRPLNPSQLKLGAEQAVFQ
jgi:hypothetical protein